MTATLTAGRPIHARISGAAPRILVVRLGSLGDIIHTLPAVAMLRQAQPEAFLGWVVEERWTEVLCSRPELQVPDAPLSPEKPLVNAVHTVTTRKWRASPLSVATLREIASAVRELRTEHYDLALDFQSAIRSAVLGRLARPQQFFGYIHAHEAPASLFYTRRIEAQGRHMVEQNASLAFAASNAQRTFAGAQARIAGEFRFPLPQDSVHDEWAAQQLASLGVSDFCLLNAGAGWGAKIWPAERWAEVAQLLAAHGLHCIVNFGPGEQELARRVEAASAGTATAIASTIGQLIALARRATLCVGGDTGPTHLAAALGVPTVAIYGPTDPARNGPFAPSATPAKIRVLRSATSVTDHARRPEPEAGLLRITAQQVVDGALCVLADE